jgi:hypothetical protein
MSTERITISTWLDEETRRQFDELVKVHNEIMQRLGEGPITLEEYIVGSLPSWIAAEYGQQQSREG